MVQLVNYRIFRKYMRDLCKRLGKSLNILTHSFRNFSMVLGKVLAPKSVLCQFSEIRNPQFIVNKNAALLKDLSKIFDCFSHNLLIAKLNAYGFSAGSLRLLQDYLSKWKQKTNINSVRSSWEVIYSEFSRS